MNCCYVGDCHDVLRGLCADSIDAIVTDPPYGLSFMGKAWDYDVPSVEIWRECLRVLKPGGHLLAFAGTRSQHRMCVNIEDAGFEIRDMIAWVYGSGFPKSRNLDGQRSGWGTALKPSLEPITVARKPIVGTVAENVLQFGTGAINIDGCRVPVVDRQQYERNASGDRGHAGTRSIDDRGDTDIRAGGGTAASGRWPANLIHDGSDEVVSLFPSEAGAQAPVFRRNGDKFRNTFGAFAGDVDEQGSTFQGDTGSAARFFYCAKASRQDRDEGCEAFDKRPMLWSSGTQNPGSFQSPNTDRSARNYHPTVKPTDLMRWLVRLVTPPRGVVLDPFAGSGSTGKAAVLEGFDYVLIERDPDYVRIAEARIAEARQQRHIATAQMGLAL